MIFFGIFLDFFGFFLGFLNFLDFYQLNTHTCKASSRNPVRHLHLHNTVIGGGAVPPSIDLVIQENTNKQELVRLPSLVSGLLLRENFTVLFMFKTGSSQLGTPVPKTLHLDFL